MNNGDPDSSHNAAARPRTWFLYGEVVLQVVQPGPELGVQSGAEALHAGCERQRLHGQPAVVLRVALGHAHPGAVAQQVPGAPDHRKEATSDSKRPPWPLGGAAAWGAGLSRSRRAEVRSWVELSEMVSISSLVMALRENGPMESRREDL